MQMFKYNLLFLNSMEDTTQENDFRSVTVTSSIDGVNLKLIRSQGWKISELIRLGIQHKKDFPAFKDRMETQERGIAYLTKQIATVRLRLSLIENNLELKENA